MKQRSIWLKKTLASVMIVTMAGSNFSPIPLQAKEEVQVDVQEEAVNAGNYELMSDVQGSSVLHCWNWSYKTIEENMQLIAECGYTAVQTSPAQQPKDYAYQGNVGMEVGYPGLAGKGNWWKLYQPVTFNVCDNGMTWLGTKAELESMCATAEKYGIKVIVDIVANHLGNIKGWQNSLSDISPQVGEYWEPDMMTNPEYWHINDLQVWMSDGREHFTQGTMGMPDLNTANKKVQKYVYEYLDELIDCGVDGFRFDAAKHIETPDDGSFASDFWPTVLGEARSHYTAKTGGNLYVYGEVLNTVGDNFSIDSYTKYMSVTDNSAGHHLLESIRNNQACSSAELHYPANKSVLWAESHDTYMNESSRYASDKSIVRTWAIIANKKDATSLFYARPYNSDDTLIDGRDGSERGNLANLVPPAQMGECETYLWASKEVAAINHFNNRFAASPESGGVSGNVAYCKRGNGVILVNYAGAGSVSVSGTGLADGSYQDEVSGNSFTVSGGNVSGNITSPYGVAVLYNNPMSNPGVAAVKISSSLQNNSKFYLDTLNLTLSAEFADSASYKVSTGETGKINGDTKISVASSAKVGDTVTVEVTGTNARGTVKRVYTYVKEDLDIDQCIFFKTKNVWTHANAYAYMEEGKEVTATNSGWPGFAMFEYDVDQDGKTIYGAQIENIESYNKVNFNNGVAEQQTSMGTYGQIYDDSTGSWSTYLEPGSGKAKVTASLDSATIRGERTVTYTVSNGDSATYSVDGGAAIPFDESVTLTVGANLLEGESQTVKIVAKKGDKVTEKLFTYTMGENKPELSIATPNGTVFEESLEVDFAVSNVTEATYQVGNEAPVTVTGEKTITIGKDAKSGDMISVTLKGKSSNGKQDKITYTYVKGAKSQPKGIFFKNTSNWSNVTAYIWNDKTQENNGKWPGVAMEVYDKDNGIYMIQPKEDAGYDHIIFSNNGASQTGDLTLGKTGQIYDGTKWSDFVGGKEPVISNSQPSGDIKEPTKVTITVKDGTTCAYKLDDGTETEFTDSVQVMIGEGLEKGQITNLVVKAMSEDGMKVEAYSYIYNGEGMITRIPSPTNVVTPTRMVTPTNTVTPTDAVYPTDTVTPTRIVTPTKEITPILTKEATPTPVKEATPTGVVTKKPTPTKVETPTPTEKGIPSPTKKATPSPTSKVTPTPTQKATPTPTKKATPSPTKKVTPTPTKKATPTPAKKKTSIAKYKLYYKSFLEYNGKVQKPTVLIPGFIKGQDYKVSYAKGCKNIGSYAITVQGIGNYTGTLKASFQIDVVKGKSYTVSGYKYKVTNTDRESGTVTVTGATNKKISSIKIKDTVKIGGCKFKITKVGAKAFANYKNAEYLSIGKNVTEIGSKAFYNDKKVCEVEINSVVLSKIGNNAFKNMDKEMDVYVPQNRIAKYKKLLSKATGFRR